MRFERVLFVVPNLMGDYGWPKNPHTGIGYLEASLEAHGVQCDVVDMHFSFGFRALKKRITEFGPDLIGVTSYTYRNSVVYEVIKRIKAHCDIPVVIGGPHVSLYRIKVITDSLADYAIKGEGEVAMWQLCVGMPLEEIPNLIYRGKDGEVHENENLPFNKILDALPFPLYSHFDLGKYDHIGIVSSRGCPHSCIYCSVNITMGRNFRPRTPENVMAELTYWYGRGFRAFDFVDDAFFQSARRIERLCDLIKQEGLTDLRLGCSQGARADRINYALLTRMREIGFCSLGFGVESANNKTLANIKKGETIEQIDEAVRMACELGYEVGLFFMVGFDGETLKDIEKSFEFAKKYPIAYANFYNIIPYPGTKLYERIEREQRFLIAPEVYLNQIVTRVRRPVFSTVSMSLVERRIALARGYDVSRQIAHRHRQVYYRHLGLVGELLAWLLTTRWLFGRLERLRYWVTSATMRAFGHKAPTIGKKTP